MRRHLPEVLNYINETSNALALQDDVSDANETDEDQPYGKPPRQHEPTISPPQNRSGAAAATLRSSAALHNVMSPTRSSSLPTGGTRAPTATTMQRSPSSTMQTIGEDLPNSVVSGQQSRLDQSISGYPAQPSPRQ